MLVSAVEVAAGHWAKEEGTPSERLRTYKADLAELLVNRCEKGVLEDVANMMAQSLRATDKFVRFLQKLLPPPPT